MKPSKQTLAVMAEWPQVQEFFQSSDGQCFFDESLARNHARGLKDKTVEKISRASLTTGAEATGNKPEGKTVQLKPAGKPGKTPKSEPGKNEDPGGGENPGKEIAPETPSSPGDSEAKTEGKEGE